jgi:hypothetical protein
MKLLMLDPGPPEVNGLLMASPDRRRCDSYQLAYMDSILCYLRMILLTALSVGDKVPLTPATSSPKSGFGSRRSTGIRAELANDEIPYANACIAQLTTCAR